jgi:hypothetical protein
MVKQETKDTIRFYADIAVIITVIFGIYSWSQDNILAHDNLEKQEQEKNMPPTIILVQNITGENGNFSSIPTFYIKKNSNKHFAMTYFAVKIGRDINKNLTGMLESFDIPRYDRKDEFYGFFTNLSYEIEDGVYQPFTKNHFYRNLDYNPIIVNNYTLYNSSNKDIITEYDVEIVDLESQISYIGIIKTKIDGGSIQPQYSKTYRPLKFNWVDIGIQNEANGMSSAEREKFYDAFDKVRQY